MAHPPRPAPHERRRSGERAGASRGFGGSRPGRSSVGLQPGDAAQAVDVEVVDVEAVDVEAGGEPAPHGGGLASQGRPRDSAPAERAAPQRWRPRWALLLALTAYSLAIWWGVLHIGAAVAALLSHNPA